MPIDERFLKKRHTTEGCLGLNNALAEKQANVWSGLTLDQRDFHQVHTVQQANFQRRAFDKEHDYYVEKKRTIDHADPTASGEPWQPKSLRRREASSVLSSVGASL